MSTDPTPTRPAAPLALPFPTHGRLVALAYRELGIAANGPPDQAKQLGDPALLPRPWDPPSCTHPDLRLEVWVWLDDVVTWINHEYVWDTAAFIPTCWPQHPHLVHDLAVLADQRRRAGRAQTSDALDDWHRYALPGFLDRMTARLKTHCEDGHQPWPSTSRHARHSSDAHHRRRVRAYREDTDRIRPEADDIPGRRPRLTVIDGEVIDDETGEVLE